MKTQTSKKRLYFIFVRTVIILIPLSNALQREIGVHYKAQNIVVEVTDSGCGIVPGIQEQIFQPFFTTKPAGESSGLGLYIVKKIIEKHQGTITFASVSGKTTFTVTLPMW
ncbi:MAG: HAMP domain-containing histidine kinase [Oscillatoriales cyanobacterium RU_3_3]|nr:HAMP domain-containing histidine kinase [Microcoleus sp. SU_5_6]NJL69665.1 HAMP domain-containing histidine kinase [Microcoleus sp. SM1_3_4]NJM64053.1 HAMP domain-containing histidine kinase [Oscillatoriales cyanobacterium RU_3_3]